MRVFVTGATGFVGAHVVAELIGAGHAVLGLARSKAGADALASTGADVQHGALEDLDSLRRAAERSDAVIHLGFNHDFSKFQESTAADRRAIETFGLVFAGSGKALIAVNGLAGLKPPGEAATENDDIPQDYKFPRASEQTALGLVSQGVHASVIRLPQVHDTVKQGLITWLVALAREKGVSPYVGEGMNRWAAAHVSDVAQLFRLVLESGEAGAKYHAVAEEGVPMRAIAETIGRTLGIPVKSLAPEEAQAHFGHFAMFMGLDLMASSALTRQKLGWRPAGPSLIADLARIDARTADRG